MALLSYNRKLLWVVIPAIVWAWLGLAAALGPPPGHGRPGGEGPVRFGIGPAGDAVFISGVLKRVEERPEQLVLTIELAPGAEHQILGRGDKPVSRLPFGLTVEYVAPGELPAGPPELDLRGRQREPRRLPSGAQGVLTQRFLLKYEERGVRVIPRPNDMPPPGGEGGPERERPRDRGRQRVRDWFEQRAPRDPAPPDEPGENGGGAAR
jgi:hypothetical protein